MIPLSFYIGLLVWAVAFVVTALAHSDLPLWGRSRWFLMMATGLTMGATVTGLVWAVRHSRAQLVPMVIALALCLGGFLSMGGTPFLLGLFGRPSDEAIRQRASANGYSLEWIEKALHGPAISAASPYMVDVYLWELRAEVGVPKEKLAESAWQ